MKYLLVTAVVASLLAGCVETISSNDNFRPFDTGDSNGPRGGDPRINGGDAGTAANARALASRTKRPDTGN